MNRFKYNFNTLKCFEILKMYLFNQFQQLHGFTGPKLRWNDMLNQKTFSYKDLKVKGSREGTLEGQFSQIRTHPEYRKPVKNQHCEFIKNNTPKFKGFKLSLLSTNKTFIKKICYISYVEYSCECTEFYFHW